MLDTERDFTLREHVRSRLSDTVVHCDSAAYMLFSSTSSTQGRTSLKLLEDRGLNTYVQSVNNLFQSICGVSDLVEGERMIYRSNVNKV